MRGVFCFSVFLWWYFIWGSASFLHSWQYKNTINQALTFCAFRLLCSRACLFNGLFRPPGRQAPLKKTFQINKFVNGCGHSPLLWRHVFDVEFDLIGNLTVHQLLQTTRKACLTDDNMHANQVPQGSCTLPVVVMSHERYCVLYQPYFNW